MLVNCSAYQQGKKITDIAEHEISDYLSRPDCFVWVAMRDATAKDLAQMQDKFKLHGLAVEDACHGHQRPKIEEYGDSLFVVMHTFDLREGELSSGEVDVFVGRNYVLSVRNNSTQGFANVRARCEQEPSLLKLGSSFVLYALMDAVVDRYFPIVDAIESEFEAIEESSFTKGSQRANIKHLYQIKRKVIMLKHALAPTMEASRKLFGNRAHELSAGAEEYFRDVYDHLSRLDTSVDAIRDTIGTAIQVNLAMVAIDESEVNKRLAAWAAIFAVATAFAGIWGMNFHEMPELSWKYGYPAALIMMSTVCGYLYYRFKKSGWL